MHMYCPRFLAALALAMPAWSFAAPVTIDFDGLASGTVVGATYAGLGVTFSNTITASFGGLPGGTPPMAIYSVSNAQFVQPGNPISATFSTAATTVSLTGLDVGEAGFTFSAYDALVGGNLLDSAQVFGIGPGVGNFQVLTLSAPGILRVEFSQAVVSNVDGTAWDNFVFDTAAQVPEPVSLALVGLGLLGMVLTSRRASPQQHAALG